MRLPTRKAEALLAYLAAAPEQAQAQARDALTSLLWAETSDQSARASLRQTLFLLGKTLDRTAIVTEGRTIALAHDAIDIDVVEFELCSASVDAEALCRAADLYRGDLLAGIAVDEPAFEEWLLAERERLRERAIDVLARLVAMHGKQGSSDRAIQAALRLLALDPFHEAAHRALMRLYANAGRRAAALHQYQACASALRCELGTEPEAETTQLYEEIAQRPPALENATPARPLKRDVQYLHTLAPQRTPLIGRDRDVTEVCRLIDAADTGLVTITGAGGTGKTRLALQVMSELLDRFDAAVFVDLAPLAESALVARAVAQALDVREVSDEPILQTLVANIADRSLLMVLDNFEHVLDAAAQVSTFVSGCPRIKVLVTSRMPLRLYGEREYVLSPLPTPDLQHLPGVAELRRMPSIELFEQRARAVKADFEISASNVASVAAICTRIDGLPLAIELAAAQVRILPPARMLARLSSPDAHERGLLPRGSTLWLLTRGARDLPARQQTLRATIAWSYELLDTREREFFRRLCVFVGGFTLEAAEVIAGDDAIDVLASLVDKHLVQQASADARFALFETIREFGLEELQAADEMAQLRQAHAKWFATLAETTEPLIKEATGRTNGLAILLQDYENLRAALAWSVSAGREDRTAANIGLRLAAALWWFWYSRGDLREGRSWFQKVLRLDKHDSENNGNPQLLYWRAKSFAGAAHLAEQQGDDATASKLMAEALKLTRSCGDDEFLGFALRTAAGLAIHEKNYEIAASQLEESLQLSQKSGDRLATALTYIRLGHLAFAQKQLERAQSFYERRLELSRADGNEAHAATVLSFLGAVSIARGNFEVGYEFSQQSLEMMRKSGASILSIVTALSNFVRVAQHNGDNKRAVRLLGALDRFRLNIGMTKLVPGGIAEDTTKELQISLGDALFKAVFRDGQEMSQERLIEYALEGPQLQAASSQGTSNAG